MATNMNDGMWFAPKRLGYGSGLPIAWQGWAMLAGHIGIILAGAKLLEGNLIASVAWIAIAGLLPLPIYAAKTRGGWKWRKP
jgi:hypothetical protein